MDHQGIAKLLNARQRRTIPDEGRPRAAVLLVLYGPNPDYRVLYTVRSYEVEHHKGEISFPGGVRDPEDRSEIDTALRETYEEIGIDREDVQVLGLLDDVVTRSNFVVTPVVGSVDKHPYRFRLFETEVAELLEVPLSHLADTANHVPHPGRPAGEQPPFPSYRFGEHVIFGATALITTRFLNTVPGIVP